jgi:ketosteroid isomerase-like protein
MSTTTSSIEALGQRWAQAELASDVTALNALLTDDFLCVGPFGFVIDKQQYVGSRQSGDLKHTAFTWDDVRVRSYGDAVIAIGAATQQSTYQSRDASGRFRVTQVFVKQAAEWLIASLHFSPIATPPGAPA